MHLQQLKFYYTAILVKLINWWLYHSLICLVITGNIWVPTSQFSFLEHDIFLKKGLVRYEPFFSSKGYNRTLSCKLKTERTHLLTHLLKNFSDSLFLYQRITHSNLVTLSDHTFALPLIDWNQKRWKTGWAPGGIIYDGRSPIQQLTELDVIALPPRRIKNAEGLSWVQSRLWHRGVIRIQ